MGFVAIMLFTGQVFFSSFWYLRLLLFQIRSQPGNICKNVPLSKKLCLQYFYLQKVEINFSLWISNQHNKVNIVSLKEILSMRRKDAWNFSAPPFIRDPWVKSGIIKFGMLKFSHATFQLSISREMWYNLLV